MTKEDLAKICFNCNYFHPADNNDFDYMSKGPFELIREPLVKMLKDKRFSYKRKNQIKNILSKEERIY
ncbi:MAG: hypothetical protein KKH34_07160 [Candidatus Omnitrophica bacterium]|nr:hypothetical protein [Candidatus Omnitrophota bacterium]